MKRMFSEDQVREIRSCYFKLQMTQKEIAEFFHCNTRTISRVINRETYKDVEDD